MKKILMLGLVLFPILLFSHYLEFGGVRNAALGGVGIGSSEDISASVWNPALLGMINKIELLSDSRKYFWQLSNDDLLFNYAALSYPFGNVGTIVFSGSFFNAADYSENKLGFHYGNQIIKNKLMLGASLYRYAVGYKQNEFTVHDPFFKENGFDNSAFDGDVGLVYSPDSKIKFGLVAYNIMNANLALDSDNNDKLPLVLGYGMVYHWKPNIKTMFDITYEIAEQSQQNNFNFAGGMEYGLNKIIQIRGGANNYNVTAGFGVKILKKDYITKFQDPITSQKFINTRSLEIALDYCVQYPYFGIESAFGDHFLGINLNYSNSSAEMEKYTTVVPPKVTKEFVTEVEADSLTQENVKVDTMMFTQKVVIDTVVIEKVKYDTVTIVKKVPDTLLIQTAKRLAIAETELKNLRNMNKAHAHLLNSLKYFYANKYDKAIKECKIAIKLAPSLSLSYIRLGSIYYRLGAIAFAAGKKDEAENYWELTKKNWQKAKRIDPNHPELLDVYKRYFKNGKIIFRNEQF
ncbi:MAG: hypothetical protein DRZ79_02595 [Candidatus Cloacimonadota bacterium]|nr:MAG: hypothetical protein DRZ79_02595 [Candidatus Cloacimonadota bacterium]